MSDPLLVLWDVDHTLIETRGIGGEVFGEAFRQATGRPMSAGMATAHGQTEPVLLEKTLDLNGIHDRDGDLFQRFADAQVAFYRAHFGELQDRGRALPGAEPALRAMREHPGIIQTVLTGNTRGAAEIKLAAFSLDRYIDLEIGAFGDDDPHRPALVDIARGRAERKHGVTFDKSDTIMVGDTPRDIEAAHTAGVRVIAVASGSSSAAELAEAGADRVIETLEGADTPHMVVSLVASATKHRRGVERD